MGLKVTSVSCAVFIFIGCGFVPQCIVACETRAVKTLQNLAITVIRKNGLRFSEEQGISTGVQKVAEAEKERVKDLSNQVIAIAARCRPGDDSLRRVRELIREGADVNFVNEEGNTALHATLDPETGNATYGVAIAHYLLDRGARTDIPDDHGTTVMQCITTYHRAIKATVSTWIPGFSDQGIESLYYRLCPPRQQGSGGMKGGVKIPNYRLFYPKGP